MKYNTTNTPTTGAVASTGQVVTKQVPPHFKGSVMARCKEAKFGPSSSTGKPMITLVWEILKPERVLCEFDGKEYDLTSLEPRTYLSLAGEDKKGNPTDNIAYLVNDLLPRLGLPAEIDDENPLKSDTNPTGLEFVGLIVELYLSSQERKEKRQLPNGTYETVKDSQGNDITRGWEFAMMNRADLLRRRSL